jgi:AraC family transcriptional regulator, regulatory protein of adaptative response / DNA-3-methyladenine glycosylase II
MAPPPDSPVAMRLPYREPFQGQALIEFFARRAVRGVEEVIDGRYRRSVRLPGGPAVVELEPVQGHVVARLWLADLRDLATAVHRCRTLMDLDCDPHAVADALGRDALLGPLVARAPGRRVPGQMDPDELAIRAVLGQQVSLAGAATLAGRLVAGYGEPLDRPLGAVTHVFPSAAAIAAADPARLAMPASRRRAVLTLAAALAHGELVLDGGADRGEARARLLALPGIGPWTADYIALRALCDPDAFLASDLSVRHALEHLGRDGGPRSAERLAAAWRPYRAYALQYLWAILPAADRRRGAPRRATVAPRSGVGTH